MEKQKGRRHAVMHKRYHEPGTAPGTLRSPEPQQECPAKIIVTQYSGEFFSEQEAGDLETCWSLQQDNRELVTWIDISGYHDPDLLRQLGSHYQIHPLSLEDVQNSGQRPKFESDQGYDFMVMYLFRQEEEISSHQVSIFLGRDYLVTLSECTDEGCLSLVRERLRKGSGNIRHKGSDYLCYCVCDALVDGFSPLLEQLGEKMDELEDLMLGNPDRNVLSRIHGLKQELLVLSRMVWAEREVINSMLRGESPLISSDTIRYLRDCYDHTVQYIDVIEVYRDMATGMVDAYLSSVSNQMNAVMKTLTIIATIFIPLTFIVGVYGMNFSRMPELTWRFGYPLVWGVMLAVAAAMAVFFRKKKWL